MQLYERYRPQTFDDFIGQEKIIKQVRALLQRPTWDRDAFWFQGPSGTGKTTLAWIIARQLIQSDFAVIEYDGDEINKGLMETIKHDLYLAPMGGGWKVYIINEAHAMTRQAVQVWLTLLERLPENRLVVFTTTEDISDDLFGDFGHPLMSRCKVFKFTNQGLAQDMAARARRIAQDEQLDGKPESAYLNLVRDCKNNMRHVLQRIDAGEMLV